MQRLMIRCKCPFREQPICYKSTEDKKCQRAQNCEWSVSRVTSRITLISTYMTRSSLPPPFLNVLSPLSFSPLAVQEFSVPSITLFERSGLWGKRVVLTDGSVNLQLAGGCSRVQSVLVEGGMWVHYSCCVVTGRNVKQRLSQVLLLVWVWQVHA